MKVNLLQSSDLNILREALYQPYRADVFKESNSTTEEFISKVKRICIDNKHESALEHIVFSFKIEGISRLCLQELVRHRIASYTVESTRYTMPKDLEEVRQDISTLEGTDDNAKYIVASKYIALYGNTTDLLQSNKEHENYAHIITMQLATLHAYLQMYIAAREEGISLDSIKYILPESWKTNLVCTMNLRSLINFMRLRLDTRAHMEIRFLSNLILSELPSVYKDLVSYACA